MESIGRLEVGGIRQSALSVSAARGAKAFGDLHEA
jgi:hypothetical protein